jgi:hypothetical protein
MSSEEQQEDVAVDRNSEPLPDTQNKVERMDWGKIDLDDEEEENRKNGKRPNKTPFFY